MAFVVAGTAVYVAGVYISASTDVLTVRWGLGEELGGLVLLAIVTNLPEVVITTSAALSNNLPLAIGNILGGIAIQTVVLVYRDVVGMGRSETLTYRAASLTLVLEGILVIAVLNVVIMGSQIPGAVQFARVLPPEMLILLLWIAGLVLVSKARTDLPWHAGGNHRRPNQRPAVLQSGRRRPG